MISKILIGIVVIVSGLFIYAAFQPADFTVARETMVAASPEALFPHINNSEKTNDWMPWKATDPEVKMTFSGPAEGVGSTARWESPGQMGTGQAVVIESVPHQSVKTEITYTKPMEMSQVSELSLMPTQGGTIVKWSVTGKKNFVSRLMCIFMDLDKYLGSEFEKGLANLKTKVEVAP